MNYRNMSDKELIDCAMREAKDKECLLYEVAERFDSAVTEHEKEIEEILQGYVIYTGKIRETRKNG